MVSIPEEEQSNGIEFFYEEKKADFITIFNMYKDLMRRLDLDYHLAFGRTRYLRGFHVDYPSGFQITSYLFLVADENNDLQIFPLRSKSKFYAVNEIPTELEGSCQSNKRKYAFDSVKIYYQIQ